MGRILDTDTYPIKQNPTASDYVIGTDSEQNGRTVNFLVGSFGGDGGGSIIQNNRFKLIKTGNALTNADVAALINAYNPTVEVLEDEIPLFITVRPPQSQDEAPKLECWGLTGVGKGVFGVGGDTTVLDSQPFIIESRTFSFFDPSDVENAVVIDFGVVADSNIQTFVDLINNSIDQYLIQAGTNWYFQGNLGGDNILYGWQGANGTFGNNGTTTTTADLFLIEDATGVNAPPSELPTGLERINEGNGDAWRLIGRDPAFRLNAGANSVDFASSSAATFGTSGTNSFSVGEDNIASGYGAITMGSVLTATGVLATVFGFLNETSGYASFMQGYNNVEQSPTGFSMTVGHSNLNKGNASLMTGVALESNNGVGTFICGAANAVVNGSNNGSSATQPMIIIGNGTHTTPVGAAWVATSRSNLLVGLRNGTFILPSTSIATIDGEATGKQVITREWIEAQGFLTIGQVGNLVTFEGGYTIAGRNADDFGTIGTNGVDFSWSTKASTTVGATGEESFATGVDNVVSGLQAFGSGNLTFASGTLSASFGEGSRARTRGEVSIGVFGTDYTPVVDGNVFDIRDRIFNIGIGTSSTRKDAFTVLKNGHVGILFDNFEAIDTDEALQVNGDAFFEGTTRQAGYTVATLPASPQQFTRAFVTDANATTFHSIVAAGGSNVVPVFYDGTNWRIG